MKQSILFADSARGIYIPQHFAESANRDKFIGIDSEQWAILEAGPDHDLYNDVWCEVLDHAETTDGGVLWQDGDLWILWPQLAIDAINAYCESCVEYETKHPDAGDAYSHMPQESWCNQDTRDLVESLTNDTKYRVYDDPRDTFPRWIPAWKRFGIDSRWEDIPREKLADIALESFTMEPGHMFGPYADGIVIAAYGVDEIEIDLEPLGIDDMTFDLIRESCECYIPNSGKLAYQSTGAAWFAVIDVDQFNAQLDNAIA